MKLECSTSASNDSLSTPMDRPTHANWLGLEAQDLGSLGTGVPPSDSSCIGGDASVPRLVPPAAGVPSTEIQEIPTLFATSSGPWSLYAKLSTSSARVMAGVDSWQPFEDVCTSIEHHA